MFFVGCHGSTKLTPAPTSTNPRTAKEIARFEQAMHGGDWSAEDFYRQAMASYETLARREKLSPANLNREKIAFMKMLSKVNEQAFDESHESYERFYLNAYKHLIVARFQ